MTFGVLLWHRPWHQHNKVSTNERTVSGLIWTNESPPVWTRLTDVVLPQVAVTRPAVARRLSRWKYTKSSLTGWSWTGTSGTGWLTLTGKRMFDVYCGS